MNKSTSRGFIALTLTLSVAGILFALVSTSSIESVSYFDQALRKEYRVMNYYNAGSCIDQAILLLAKDYFFRPAKLFSIPEYKCEILSITGNNDDLTITTKGNFQNADVYRAARVKLNDLSIEVLEVN